MALQSPPWESPSITYLTSLVVVSHAAVFDSGTSEQGASGSY